MSRRGPPPHLIVTCGSREGASMRVPVVGDELEVARKEGGLVEGQVTRWAKVGVVTGLRRDERAGRTETTYRYWLLEPGGAQRRIELEPFKVVGRFTIVEQKNGKGASEAFKGLGSDTRAPASGRAAD